MRRAASAARLAGARARRRGVGLEYPAGGDFGGIGRAPPSYVELLAGRVGVRANGFCKQPGKLNASQMIRYLVFLRTIPLSDYTT